MFSEKENFAVDYHTGSLASTAGITTPLSLKTRKANTYLLASYITVRENCEEVCSNDLLNGLPDDEKEFYRKNSQIGQNNIKEVLNSTSKALDGCIRRCFGNIIYNLL